MNAADALYGITMQEKGISTLISVDLIDKGVRLKGSSYGRKDFSADWLAELTKTRKNIASGL